MQIEQAGGRVEVGQLPTIQADPLQMRQLLQNLIGNALKFRRPDEPPVVKVEGRFVRGRSSAGPRRPAGRAKSAASSSRTTASASISGTRSASSASSNACTPRRLRGDGHRPGAVPQDRRAPRRHDHRPQQPRPRLVFEVLLPVVATAGSRKAHEPMAKPARRTILMADDDAEDCLLVREALRETGRGCDLRFVRDGEELLDYLVRRGEYADRRRRPVPDLILLDLKMPRKDGREALRELKADPRFRQIPVVVLTTSTDQRRHRVFLRMGVNSYMTKPVTFRDLVEISWTLSASIGSRWSNCPAWIESQLPWHAKQRVRILLVEDDPDDVWVMRNLLGDRWDGPFELVHVELLSAAIERCAEDPFDVILLDLTLPDSHGLETFFAMHAHAGDVPIVVLSGYDDEPTRGQGRAGRRPGLSGQGPGRTTTLLVRSIRYAIERSRRHRAEEALRDTSEEFRAAQEIQQRLYPAESPALPGFDIAGALFPGQGHRRRLLRLHPHARRLPGRRRRRRQQPRHGPGPVDVGNPGLPAHAGPDPRRRGRDPHPRQPRCWPPTPATSTSSPWPWPGSIPATARWSTPAPASGATCSTPGVEATVLDSTSLPLGVRRRTVVPAAAPIALAARRPDDLLHRRRGRGRIARPGPLRRRPGAAGDSLRARQAGRARSSRACTRKSSASAATSRPATTSRSWW